MTDLQIVEKFVVPRKILAKTTAFLQETGRADQEGWIMWIGDYDGFRFLIREARIPEQTASSIHAHVDEREIRRFFDGLRHDGLHLAAQVHSHPGSAFHSSIDNEYAIATQFGALSIVVPNYCEKALMDLSGCAVFRLGPSGWCGPLPRGAKQELFQVVDG